MVKVTVFHLWTAMMPTVHWHFRALSFLIHESILHLLPEGRRGSILLLQALYNMQ